MRGLQNRPLALVRFVMVLGLVLAACSTRVPTPPSRSSSATAAPVATPASPVATVTAGPTADPQAASITLDTGRIQGMVTGDLAIFKGIPYAAPPIGSLRWREPQPVEPWTGVRDTTRFVHDCMQAKADFEPIQTTPSEDCLYLNVWKPLNADANLNLPVLVWVHGGGFVGGGTSIPFYDGSAFARRGIVVVSFNYRLGRLGFFAHPALAAAREGVVGNFGYMDQIAALKWVQTHIGAFGGDPQKVTLVGESAGGASVLTLVTSPLAKDLFQQAMVMSGGGRQPLITRPMTGGTAQAPSADQVDAKFAESLGIPGSGADALAALRARPAEDFSNGLDLGAVLQVGLSCQAAELKAPANYDPSCRPPLEGTPMIDGLIVPDTPEVVLQSGRAHYVPFIIGTTAADLMEFFPPSVTDPYAYFGPNAQAARNYYRLPFLVSAALILKGQAELRNILPVVSIGADMTMHEPARFVARQMTSRFRPAWLYRFTYTAESTRPDSKKQAHAGELPFLFETVDARYGDKTTANDRDMARIFNTYVANFVKTGNPNGEGLAEWPQFDAAQHHLLDFSLEDGPLFGPDSRAEGIKLVEQAAEATSSAGVP